MKVAILTNILAPYRIKLFEEIGSLVADLTVILMAHGHEHRHWVLPKGNFKTALLPGMTLGRSAEKEPIHINWGVISTLRKIRPDVVVSGGFGAANIGAFIYCKLFRCRYVGWAELTLQDRAASSFLRRMVRRILIRGSHGSIASSTIAKQAFEAYGARERSVLLSVMPIDVQLFRNAAQAFRNSQRYCALRAQYAWPRIIAVGRLVDPKGYRQLFAIYEKVLARFPDATLLIAGEGRERENYAQLIASRRLRAVHLLGHVQEKELIEYFSIADLFIFPSLFDQFGAVVSEALAAGVPTVSSIHAAATHDLIEHGKTGFCIDPTDVESATEVAFHALSLDSQRREILTNAGYEKIKRYDYSRSARDMVCHLQSL